MLEQLLSSECEYWSSTFGPYLLTTLPDVTSPEVTFKKHSRMNTLSQGISIARSVISSLLYLSSNLKAIGRVFLVSTTSLIAMKKWFRVMVEKESGIEVGYVTIRYPSKQPSIIVHRSYFSGRWPMILRNYQVYHLLVKCVLNRIT